MCGYFRRALSAREHAHQILFVLPQLEALSDHRYLSYLKMFILHFISFISFSDNFPFLIDMSIFLILFCYQILLLFALHSYVILYMICGVVYSGNKNHVHTAKCRK